MDQNVALYSVRPSRTKLAPGIEPFRIYLNSSLENRTTSCTEEANLWQCLYTSIGNTDWRVPQEAHLKAAMLKRISASGYDSPFDSRGRRRPSRGGIRCELQVTDIKISRADSCKLSGAADTTVSISLNFIVSPCIFHLQSVNPIAY
jgi:hypothetical protein